MMSHESVRDGIQVTGSRHRTEKDRMSHKSARDGKQVNGSGHKIEKDRMSLREMEYKHPNGDGVWNT